MPRSDLVKCADVAHTLEWLRCAVNKQVVIEQENVASSNASLLSAFCKGEVPAATLLSSWKEAPREIQSRSIKHLAAKFKRERNYSKQTTNTAGNYLEADDVKMLELLAFLSVNCIWPLPISFPRTPNIPFCWFFSSASD